MSEDSRERAYGGGAARVGGAHQRYRHSQRQARRGGAQRVDRPRPLEFDESGFPIPQTGPSFLERVARLLNPS